MKIGDVMGVTAVYFKESRTFNKVKNYLTMSDRFVIR